MSAREGAPLTVFAAGPDWVKFTTNGLPVVASAEQLAAGERTMRRDGFAWVGGNAINESDLIALRADMRSAS